ncbi:peptidase inhibitor family I36 protein [Cryptosporangium japonicum]|uniref:Peptidase inhibitor family I36 n=1 Tax=Cryptosporangium japonicum TaxID=80872 RepID=A0ABP3EPS7_9ACTN
MRLLRTELIAGRRPTRRRAASASLAAALGLTAALFAAQPAQASLDDCAKYTGTICLFEHSGYNGQLWRQYPAQVEGCRSFVPDAFNDEASFIENRSGRQITVYEHANCTGASKTVKSLTHLELGGTSFNDKASAIKIT